MHILPLSSYVEYRLVPSRGEVGMTGRAPVGSTTFFLLGSVACWLIVIGLVKVSLAPWSGW